MVNLTTVRGFGRNGRRWVLPALVAISGLLASACTFELRDLDVTVPCTSLRFEVNTNDVPLSAAQLATIDAAVAEFAALVGRDSENLGATESQVDGHAVGDPVLVEVAWPDDAPAELGYAEPLILKQEYVGGWIMLNPRIRQLPNGVLRRLVLHELGHLFGLADVTAADELMNPHLTVDDWGAGDLTGLFLTHEGGCDGSTLLSRFEALPG